MVIVTSALTRINQAVLQQSSAAPDSQTSVASQLRTNHQILEYVSNDDNKHHMMGHRKINSTYWFNTASKTTLSNGPVLKRQCPGRKYLTYLHQANTTLFTSNKLYNLSLQYSTITGRISSFRYTGIIYSLVGQCIAE